MSTIEVTDEMVETFRAGAIAAPRWPVTLRENEVTRAGLAAVLADPAVRQAVLAAAEAEHTDMLGGLPDWDQLSDLDKGATLMFLAKVENEGVDYAAKHYPAQFLDAPALVALGPEDACEHMLSFDEDIFDELDGDEHMRLYNLALYHDPEGQK